ncbi:MAG: hypothetical protein ACRCYE_07160 [Sarcina sp.]
MKKFLTTIVIGITFIMVIWGIFTINLSATEVFANSKYEVNNVDYKKIKEDTGLDLEKLSRDDSFMKTYRENNDFIIVVGNYKINLVDSFLGKIFISCMDTIDKGINNLKNFMDELIY